MLQPLSVRLRCHLSRGVSLGSAAAPQTRDSEPRRGAPFPGPAARPLPVCPWPPPPRPKPGPCVSLCSRSLSPGGHVPADAIRWGAKSLLVSSPHLCSPPTPGRWHRRDVTGPSVQASILLPVGAQHPPLPNPSQAPVIRRAGDLAWRAVERSAQAARCPRRAWREPAARGPPPPSSEAS